MEKKISDLIINESKGNFKNISHFSKFLADKYPERSQEAWRWMLRQKNNQDPSLFKHFGDFDYNAQIPLEWDGTHTELARLMTRRYPNITLDGWLSRIQRAYRRNSITESIKPDYIVKHLRKAAESSDDLWDSIEKISQKAIFALEDERWAEIEMLGDRYIGIAFSSDQHIGNPFCDHKRLREDAEQVADHPDCYMIHAGDYIDNFIIDKPRPAMKSPIPPNVQWKLCEHYINMCEPSLMAIVAGNHDLWTAAMTDYDPLKRLAADRGILYQPHELNLRVIVGEVNYHISVRHQRRGNSQLDPARVVKKMWDDGEADFDIGVVGHHHVPIVAPFTKHGLERWAIRPGAYKIVDKFSEMCGFARDRPTCPMVILNPKTREIQAFSDLRHGLAMLDVLNGRQKDDMGV